MKTLMVIEVAEPFFLNARTRKASQLLLLSAGYTKHLLPKLVNKQPQVLWSRGSRAFQPHPILVGSPPLGVWPSRAGYHCFPMLSSL